MKHIPRWQIGIFVLALLGLLGFGAWFYQDQGRRYIQDTETDLQSISQLKADQIDLWRTERLHDGDMLTDNSLFSEDVAQWLSEMQPEAADALRAQFLSLAANNKYADIQIVDTSEKVCFDLDGQTGPLPPETLQAIDAARASGHPVMTDLFIGTDAAIRIDVVAPLFTPQAGQVGTVILRIDPNQVLYPIIQTWPVPSSSAETLLVRRDGDAMLYLNELRHQKNTALQLRIPLTRTEVPAVEAVLGKTGVIPGTDYRGVEVVAAIQPVPDSDWFIVAKEDMSESLGEWQSHALLIVGSLLLALLLIAAVIGMLWQRNDKAHYRMLYHSETARQGSEARYTTTLMSIGDGVIVADAAGRVELLNPVAEALTGWRQAEAHGRPVAEIFQIINEETRQPVENPIEIILQKGGIVGLANHTLLISRDGSEHPIADSGAPIRWEEGATTGVVLVFRDQSAERDAQKALQDSEVRYRRLFEAARDGILILDAETGMIVDVNPFLIEMLGFSREQFREKKVWELGFFKVILASQDNFLELQQREYVRYEDLPLETADGRRIDVEFVSNMYRVDHRKVIQCNVRDITEYTLAEVKLRQALERLDLAARAARLGIWDWNLVRNELVWDDRMFELYGVKRTEHPIAYEAWLAGIHPDDRAASDEISKQAQRGEREYDTEFRVVWSDGSVHWLKAYGQFVWDAAGQPLRMTGVNYDITERRQAEEVLRESEERYRELIEHIPSGVAVYEAREGGRDFIFRDFNTAGERIDHDSRERLIGRSVLEMRPGIEQFGLLDVFRRVWKTGQPESFPVKQYADERLAGWYENYIYRLPSGEIVAVFENVTERKKMEEGLRLSEAKFRAVVENSHDGILFGDTEATILYRSPSYNRMNGYTDEESIGHSGFETAHPDDLERIRRWWAQLLEHPELSHTAEYRILHKDGKWRWIESSGQNLLSNPDVHSVIVISRDITDRRQTEEALRESEEKYRILFSNAVTGMFRNKIDGSAFLDVNQRLAEMFGYTVEELMKMPVRNLYADPMERDAMIRLLGERGTLQNYEIRAIHKSGKILNLEISLKLYPREAYLEGTAIDITERKQAADALRASEEKFRKAFMTSPEAISINRLNDGLYVSINRGFTRIMGYTDEDILGKTSIEKNIWVDAGDRNKLAEGLRKDGLVENLEAQFRSKTGEIKYGMISAARIELDGIQHILGIVRDITDRKQAEAELKKRMDELVAWQTVTIGREGRVMELKIEINELLAKLGQSPRYREPDL